MNESDKEFYNSVSRSIGREKAIEMSNSGWWEGMEAKDIAMVGMTTRELCLPFPILHKAIQDALGRQVWTHELGLDFKGIYFELIGEKDAPTFEEIVNLIPEQKRLIIQL